MQRKAKGRETDKRPETPVKRTTSAVNCMLIDDPTDGKFYYTHVNNYGTLKYH
jgi:hypothetical protein